MPRSLDQRRRDRARRNRRHTDQLYRDEILNGGGFGYSAGSREGHVTIGGRKGLVYGVNQAFTHLQGGWRRGEDEEIDSAVDRIAEEIEQLMELIKNKHRDA